MPLRLALVTAGLASALVAGVAGAGGGTSPSKIGIELTLPLTTVAQTWVLDAGGVPVGVYLQTAEAPVNPEGLSIIRGGNHAVPRKVAGKPLDLGRIEGDVDGNIAMLYRSGLQQYIRVAKPDNTLAFDVLRPLHRHAGTAPDGEGGAYVVTHKSYKPPGSALADQTQHTTIRYSPTGTILWEVEQAPADSPYTVPQHRSTAAKSSSGVFVGYAVEGRSETPRPIVLHQAAADGATIFANEELRGPKLVAGKVAQGVVGTGELEGFVEHVVAANDGSVIAVVHNHGHEQYVIRLDATGQQTATFVCNGRAVPMQPREVACIDHVGDFSTFEYSRYAISDGNLVRTVAPWKAPKKAGRTYGPIAGTPGRQLLVSTRENDELRLMLLSKTGNILVELDTNNDRTLSSLGAGANTWFGTSSTHVARGTFSIGGPTTSSAQQVPSGAIPRAVKKAR
jgi:hypothetical protein